MSDKFQFVELMLYAPNRFSYLHLRTVMLFFFIQAAGLAYHHHALACIYLRLDEMQCFAS